MASSASSSYSGNSFALNNNNLAGEPNPQVSWPSPESSQWLKQQLKTTTTTTTETTTSLVMPTKPTAMMFKHDG